MDEEHREGTDESEDLSPSKKKPKYSDSMEVTMETPTESCTEEPDDRSISHAEPNPPHFHFWIPSKPNKVHVSESFDSFESLNMYKTDDSEKRDTTIEGNRRILQENQESFGKYRINLGNFSESSSSDESDIVSVNTLLQPDLDDLDITDEQKERNQDRKCASSTSKSSDSKITGGTDSLVIKRLWRSRKYKQFYETIAENLSRVSIVSLGGMEEVNSTKEGNLTRDSQTPANRTTGDFTSYLESLEPISICSMHNSLEDNSLPSKSIVNYKNARESESNTELKSCVLFPCSFSIPLDPEHDNVDSMANQSDDTKREIIGYTQNDGNSLREKESYYPDTASSMVIDSEIFMNRLHANILSENGESNGSYTPDVAEQKKMDTIPSEEKNSPERKKARYSSAYD